MLFVFIETERKLFCHSLRLDLHGHFCESRNYRVWIDDLWGVA